MNYFYDGLWIEACFQMFRREHGIGNGLQNRQKFMRLFPLAMKAMQQSFANGKILVAN
jgi:hypothetical protein